MQTTEVVVVSQLWDHGLRKWEAPEILAKFGSDEGSARCKAMGEWTARAQELCSAWNLHDERFPWLERILVCPRHLDFYGEGRDYVEAEAFSFCLTIGVE